MNLPNKLTILRVLLIPFFIAVLKVQMFGTWSRYVALFVFIIASLTDFFDGRIARKYNLVTNFGKFMDPLADKLLVCSALVCFVAEGSLADWFVIIIIAREFIISGFRLVASDAGVVIAASFWGKIKTVTQLIMIILILLDIQFFRIVTAGVSYLALILTLVSLIDYISKNKAVLMRGGM